VHPHDTLDATLDAESCVLAAMLLDPQAIAAAVRQLRAEDFARPQHARVFLAMVSIFERGDQLDLVTLADELRRRGELDSVGGSAALAHFPDWTATSANVEQHARLVREASALRKIRRSTDEATQELDRGDASKPVSERLQNRLIEIQSERSDDLVNAHDLMPTTMLDVSDIAENKASAIGIPTGFRDLDRIVRGFKPGNLVVIAGRPSMGKTALALNIADNVASAGYHVGVVSLEMTSRELGMRLVCARAEVSANSISTGLNCDAMRNLTRAAASLSELPISFYDASMVSALDILSRCVAMNAKRKLDVLIVDYLQLISPANTRENRAEQIAETTRYLKGLARRLQVPVIALSQLNRALEGRPERRPQLSDLRGSGAIEQDADQVLFVFREELHKPRESALRGRAEVIVAKNRNGPIGDARLRFVHELAKFTEADEWQEAEQQAVW